MKLENNIFKNHKQFQDDFQNDTTLVWHENPKEFIVYVQARLTDQLIQVQLMLLEKK